jgi:hypothetical protein
MRSVGKRALAESGKHPVNEDDEEIFAHLRAKLATSAASSNSRYCAEAFSRHCERAKQSIARHNGWMDCFAALAMTALTPAQNVNARHKAGHNVVFVDSERFNYAWLATVLPSAAWAAARRAIGTR